MDPTLRQLRYFDAVARHGHFGRAAAECAVTQPALSMQIAELEARLGAVLVERTRTGAVMTEAGAEVARRAKRILGEVSDLGALVHARGTFLRGELKLGVIPSVAPYVLPRLLPLIRIEHPQLKLQLRETTTRILLDELLAGGLDLLLLALPVNEDGIATHPLFVDPFFLAVPRGSPATQKAWSLEEIVASERLLLLEEGHCLRDQALSVCALQPDGMVDTFGVSSISTIVQMVGNGYGITLLPAMAVSIEVGHSDAVSLLPFDPPQPQRSIGLAWRTSSPFEKEFAACGALVKACMGMQSEGGTVVASPQTPRRPGRRTKNR